MRRTLHALFLLAVAAGSGAGSDQAIQDTPTYAMKQGKVADDLADLAAALMCGRCFRRRIS